MTVHAYLSNHYGSDDKLYTLETEEYLTTASTERPQNIRDPSVGPPFYKGESFQDA